MSYIFSSLLAFFAGNSREKGGCIFRLFEFKRLSFFIFVSFLCFSTQLFSQTVTIPAANTDNGSVNDPFGTFWGYERTALIYTPAEIGATGNITSIRFYVNSISTPGDAINVRVYMKLQPSTFTAATTYATETTGATLVYGPTTILSTSFITGNWITIPLTTPFNYTGGTDNLEVIIETNQSVAGNEGSTAKQFRYTTQGNNQYYQYWFADNSIPTGTGTLSNSRPNIQLDIASLTPCAGTPNNGTASISSSSGCTGTSFTLSATGITTDGGTNYQWQSATSASGPWSNIAGATNASSTTSAASAGTTYYQLVSTCTNGGAIATSNVVSYTATACVIMPTSGVTYITSCGTTIYDSGGSGGDYSNNESGTVIIRPTSMTDVVTVTGTCTLRNNDLLNIDEGEDSNTGTFFSQFTGTAANQVVSYTGPGPGIPIAVQFVSNGNNVNPGFALTVSCACAKPTAITLTTSNATDCSTSGSVTVNSVTAPDQKPWIMTTFQSDALPALSWLPTAPATNAWISGNSTQQNANNNMVQLTDAVAGQSGALVFESYGVNQNELYGNFDIFIDNGGWADGMAFSYGPSISTTNPTSANGFYESGVGNGLIISFDTYNNGAGVFPNFNGTNYSNIYLIYNGVVLASYSNANETTLIRGSQKAAELYISPTGALSLTLGGTAIFTAVALPAAYSSTDKSLWRAAFTARTGQVVERHRVDNINIFHYYDFEYSINGSTWQTSPTFSGLAAGTYTMYVRLAGITGCSYTQSFTVSGLSASVAPTSITGTSSICNGGSTTLTTAGGSLGVDGDDIWYEGSCPTECYTQDFITQPFPTSATTLNNNINGILNVSATSSDPSIDMTSVGSFNASNCRYISIRYRVTAGTGGQNEIYFSKTGGTDLSEAQVVRGNLISDGNWNIMNLDMSTNPNWSGTITGWRFDWTWSNGVSMDIDFITLSNVPILSVGTSITVSPTVNTTYFTLKKGACNTTSCVSKTVTVNNPFTLSGVWDNSVICSSQTATYTVTPSTPGAYSYAWTVPAGATNPGNTNVITTGVAGLYSVTATLGACTATTSSTLTVNASNTITLTSATNTPTYCTGSAANITYSTTNATGATYSGLPAGVTGNFNAGVITLSGTITDVAGTYNYTVTLTGGCGSGITASGTITVYPSNLINNSGGSINNTLCLGSILPTISYTTSSGSYTLTGINVTSLPAGTSASSGAGTTTISGTPTASGVFNYVVVSNEGCTATGTITVNGSNTISLTSAAGTNNQQACRNTAITPVTYATTAATNATISWTPSIPTGLSGAWAGNVYTISGTPTVAGTYNYTVTTTGGCTPQVTATGTIIVNALPTVSGVSTVATTCSNLNQSAVFTISGTSGTTVSYTLNGTPGTITLSSNTAQITIPSVTTTQTMVLTSVTNGTCAITPTGSAMTATTTVSSTCQPMTECNLAVLTIGSGSALTTSSTAAFAQTVQERLTTDGSVTSLSWTSNFTDNTGSGGTNNLLTNEGLASNVSTGFMNSYNGILGIPGYTSTVGTTTVSTTNTKAVSLINGLSGTLQSRTVLPTSAPIPFNSSAFRSVLPVTSTTFYAAGSGSSSTGGIWYVDITNASSPVYTQLFTTTGNIRNLEIYNGTLYFSGTAISVNATSTIGIFQLGTAGTLPTTGSPAVSTVISYASGVPGGFAISPDGCTIYVADASGQSTRRGITKWSNASGTWTAGTSNYTPTNPSNSAQFSYAFGLTADFSGTENKIYYTAGYSSLFSSVLPNTLFGVKETGSGNTATWASLFTPVTVSNYRLAGIDLSPNSYKPFTITTQPISSASTCVGASTTLTVATDYVGTVNYQWFKNTSSGSLCSSGWVAVGTNSPNYTFTPGSSGTEYYYVKIWTSCASVQVSNVSTITIGTGSLITASITPSSSIPICAGSSVTLTASGSNGTLPYTYSWATTPVQTTDAITVNTDATYTVTVTSAAGCTATQSITVSSTAVPNSPTIGTIIQPNCSTTTGSVDLSGLPSGTWTINPGAISGTGSSTTISSLSAGTYNFTVTNSSGCTSGASNNAVINTALTIPTPPTIGTITHPSCALATGSVVLNDLPSSGTWTITSSPSLTIPTGTGTTTTISGLTASTTYTFTVTNADGCTSTTSTDAVINAQPTTPSAPLIGAITQANCGTSTGSVALSGLPSSGTWTVTGSPSGSATGTGTTGSVTGLTAGTTYTFTVTNASNCTSSASLTAILTAAPNVSTAPTIGTITQPSCATPTGSVALSDLPSGAWTVTGSPSGSASGSGTTGSVTGLTAGTTYTFTVTNTSSGCTSTATGNVVIDPLSGVPTAPVIGTITQPTCTVATASVSFTGLPSSGTWTVNSTPSSGSLTNSGTTGTITGLIEDDTYTFTVTDANGCTSAASVPVLINAQPTTPVIDAQAGPCVGSVAPINVTATGGLAPYNVSWTGTTSGNPAGTEIANSGDLYSITGLGSGTYSVTITDANNCTAVQNSITIACASCTNPTIDTQALPISECIGGTQTLTIVASGTSLTYQWFSNTLNSNSGGTLIATGTSATYTPSSASAGTVYYYCVVSSSTCTTTSNAVAAVVNPNNIAGPASSNPTVCINTALGSPITIATNGATGIGSATGLPTGVSASWSSDVITISGTPSASGTFNYSIPLSGGCGSINATGTITVSAVNTAGSASSNPSVCLGTAISPNITINTTGATGIGSPTGLPTGVSASWSGDVITISGTPSTLVGSPFTYTIPLSGGCGTVDATGTITVVDTPTAPAVGTITQPDCSSATGSVAFTGLPAGGTWTINGTPSGTLTNSGTTATISGLTQSTTYTFTVTFGGCTSAASANAVITAQPSIPAAITAILVQPTCVDATGEIKVTSPAAGTGITFTVTGTSPVVAAIIQSTTIFSGLNPGVYSVTASNGTCSTAAVSYTINPQPSTPTISGSASTCINATTQLTGSPTAAASNPWTSSNTGVATVSNTGLVTGVAEGSTTITYTNTDGCSATVSVTISDIIDFVNLQWPANGSICVGGTFDVYGQIYNTGTVNTPDVGQAPGVTVQFGYSTTNTNPSTWLSSAWTTTTTLSNGNAGPFSNNDEYSGTFTGLPAGTYYYAFRYQINGCGWQYGGYSSSNGGFWNGTSNVSGVLTVNAAPSILFISPP